MPSTPDTLIRDIRMEFDDVLDFVTGEQARAAQVYAIERGLLGRLLALGRQLLALFLAVRARESHRSSVATPQGRRLPYHSDKRRSYLSIFGLIRFARPYFYGQRLGGSLPLDAALGLPRDRYSDLLREMTESLSVEVPYSKTATFFERFFSLGLSSRVLAEMIEGDALNVEAFYQAKAALELPRFSGRLIAWDCNLQLMLRFIRHGRLIIEGRVTPMWIIPPFDEAKDGHPRLGPRGELFATGQFALERGEETLAHGVIPNCRLHLIATVNNDVSVLHIPSIRSSGRRSTC